MGSGALHDGAPRPFVYVCVNVCVYVCVNVCMCECIHTTVPGKGCLARGACRDLLDLACFDSCEGGASIVDICSGELKEKVPCSVQVCRLSASAVCWGR